MSEDPNEYDSVTLEWFNAARLPTSESLSFESATGLGSVSSLLTWTPECSLLDYGEEVTYYDLTFLVYDNGCPTNQFDTMGITIGLQDTRAYFDQFLPPNVFTPNGDGINDVFTLTGLLDFSMNLPPDNCDDAFEAIEIYNRTGVKVYQSSSREFVWDGDNAGAGSYFYHIKYQKTDFKGVVQLLR